MDRLLTILIPLAIYYLIVLAIFSSRETNDFIQMGKQAHRDFLRKRLGPSSLFWTRLQNEEKFYDTHIKAHEEHLRTLSPPKRIELGP